MPYALAVLLRHPIFFAWNHELYHCYIVDDFRQQWTKYTVVGFVYGIIKTPFINDFIEILNDFIEIWWDCDHNVPMYEMSSSVPTEEIPRSATQEDEMQGRPNKTRAQMLRV